jgi:hypothetical protein
MIQRLPYYNRRAIPTSTYFLRIIGCNLLAGLITFGHQPLIFLENINRETAKNNETENNQGKENFYVTNFLMQAMHFWKLKPVKQI